MKVASSSSSLMSPGGKSGISSMVGDITVSTFSSAVLSSVVRLGSPRLSSVCEGILRESALIRALGAILVEGSSPQSVIGENA